MPKKFFPSSASYRKPLLKQFPAMEREAAGLNKLIDNGMDVRFVLTTGSSASTGKPISFDTFTQMVSAISEEIDKELHTLASQMASDVKSDFVIAINDRPRKDTKSLKEVIFEALKTEVRRLGSNNAPDVFKAGVLDMSEARLKTSGSDYGFKRGGNLFDLLEFGSPGGRGQILGSSNWGFLSLERAMDLARQASDWAEKRLSWTPERTQEFLDRIQKVFSNSRHVGPDHEIGINVQLNRPLFAELHKWGGDGSRYRYAGEFVRPHNPRPSMQVLNSFPGPKEWVAKAGDNWLPAAIGQAIDRAVAKVTKGL